MHRRTLEILPNLRILLGIDEKEESVSRVAHYLSTCIFFTRHGCLRRHLAARHLGGAETLAGNRDERRRHREADGNALGVVYFAWSADYRSMFIEGLAALAADWPIGAVEIMAR